MSNFPASKFIQPKWQYSLNVILHVIYLSDGKSGRAYQLKGIYLSPAFLV